MLDNPGEGLKIPQELQNRIDIARSNLTLAEQDCVRVKTLAQDQEAVVRGMLDYQERVTEENLELDSQKAELTTVVDELLSKKDKMKKETMALDRTIVAMKEELVRLDKSAQLFKTEIETSRKTIAEARAKHEQWLRETEAISIAETKEAEKISNEIQVKKAKLMSVLAEM